jgi:hypothetical protein
MMHSPLADGRFAVSTTPSGTPLGAAPGTPTGRSSARRPDSRAQTIASAARGVGAASPVLSLVAWMFSLALAGVHPVPASWFVVTGAATALPALGLATSIVLLTRSGHAGPQNTIALRVHTTARRAFGLNLGGLLISPFVVIYAIVVPLAAILGP